MTTNFNQTDAVEDQTSTASASRNSFHTLSDPLTVIRTGNTDITSDTINETTTQSIRRFSCAVCNIELLNQKSFNSHLNSRQHHQAQSIHDVLQSVAPEYRPAYKAMFSPEMLNKKVFNRDLRCAEQIKEIKEPLLGLNYIIEFQFANPTDSAQYICELCHCKCSSQSILSHILHIQHQQKFLKTHHPDMHERVLSASSIRSEQQRLIENYAKQIQSRHGGPGHVQLHIQLDSYIGQKPVVLAVTFKSQGTPHAKGQKKMTIQLTSKPFEEYDYPFEDEKNKEENEELIFETPENNHGDSIQRGLSAEDLLYPFDRQYWYQNYKDLLESRPIDPHSVTYQEIISNSNSLQPFQGIMEKLQPSPLSVTANENHLTLENGQTIRRNNSQPSNRRVILDTTRPRTLTNNGILRISPTKNKPIFDGYTLLNEQQKKTTGTNAVLNEQSARAILAASGLLQSDEEDEHNIRVSNQSSMRTTEAFNSISEQTVSPLIAKRMLDAVLNGDLDVVHIQPYFSTFVNLIQSGQVELERHQAERLLHKVLVTSSSSSSSPTNLTDPVLNSNKRARSDSHSSDRHPSATSRYHHEEYHPPMETNERKYSSSSSSSSSTTRRVHLRNETKTTNGKRSFD